MTKRRPAPEISLSFLDVICCGFGAVILLLMITKTVEPQVLEESTVIAEGRVAELTEQLFTIRGETAVLNRDLAAKREQLSSAEDRIAILREQINATETLYQNTRKKNSNTEKILQGLQGDRALARQKLTEVEKRLLGIRDKRENELIGGIPVDSEYIIFVIDSSGSMRDARPRVLQEIQETLAAYPTVKGIQVINGRGRYLFPSRRGDFLEDTPEIRQLILSRLPNWDASDTSIPTRGIQTAIQAHHNGKRKISIYVYGDDYGGNGAIGSVIRAVDKINQRMVSTERLIRVHAVGFPTLLMHPFWSQPALGFSKSVNDFANLMRELAYRNGGTFVALDDYRP